MPKVNLESNDQPDIPSWIYSVLGLSVQEIANRKTYLEITNIDCQVLRELSATIAKSHQHIMQSFYNHLEQFEPIRSKLGNQQAREQLSEKQRSYLS